MTPASEPSLTLADVDERLGRIMATRGSGSAAERRRLLAELFGQATRAEQEFLFLLIIGELRQGALEGVMVEAIARAAGLPVAEIRRAVMVSGQLAPVAEAALGGGEAALGRFAVEVFRPLRPMLAQTAEDAEEALRQFSPAGFEYKLDGARVQVHKSGSEVRIFTRELNDVTAAAPEIVEAVAALPADEPHPRRRGDRLPAGRHAAAVPGDDAPLRAEARRRRDARDVAALGAVLRLPDARRDAR